MKRCRLLTCSEIVSLMRLGSPEVIRCAPWCLARVLLDLVRTFADHRQARASRSPAGGVKALGIRSGADPGRARKPALDGRSRDGSRSLTPLLPLSAGPAYRSADGEARRRVVPGPVDRLEREALRGGGRPHEDD